MAKKPVSFRTDAEKKTITIYTNVEKPAAEASLIEFYLGNGYIPLMAEKKKGKTVADMRKDLKDDEKTLKAFNEAYAQKEAGGFHAACKIYAEWKKNNK